MFLEIKDGEEIREFLGNVNSNLQEMGLGRLVRGAVVLELTRFRYEISFLDTIFGINSNSPEYQTVKPILENTLKRIYQKNKDYHERCGLYRSLFLRFSKELHTKVCSFNF